MKFAVLVFPGSSCDVDMLHAVKEIAGQDAEAVWHIEADLTKFDAVLIPTGASYGNYLRPGALARSSKVVESLKEFAASGKPVLGVGNGFHILTELGLLPGAFLHNPSLKFRSGSSKLIVENASTTFTLDYKKGQAIKLPFAHEFGNYFVDKETEDKLKKENRIVFTYADDTHDNSTGEIAGVLNEAGNVLGMMPLPERAVEEIIGGTDGLALFTSILKRWNETNVSHA